MLLTLLVKMTMLILMMIDGENIDANIDAYDIDNSGNNWY